MSEPLSSEAGEVLCDLVDECRRVSAYYQTEAAVDEGKAESKALSKAKKDLKTVRTVARQHKIDEDIIAGILERNLPPGVTVA